MSTLMMVILSGIAYLLTGFLFLCRIGKNDPPPVTMSKKEFVGLLLIWPFVAVIVMILVFTENVWTPIIKRFSMPTITVEEIIRFVSGPPQTFQKGDDE